MGAFETIEARLQLSADAFQAGIGNAVNSLGSLQNKATGTHKAVGALGVGLAAVAAGGIAKSVGASMDLQSALTESQAIMGDLTQGEMKAMEQAARDVGKTTTFSAAEAGDAFYYLASAGMDAEQSVASMGDVAQFAQAGAFDLATATDLATDAQSALGMASEDAAENAAGLNQVMDVLVKSNTLANASVQEFSEALTNKAGAALKQTNKEIEEGAAVLAAYADQGIKGRKAGERLNIVLRDLQTAAREEADAFENLGVSVYDADGEMRNMADIIADLETATEGMTTEQKNAALATLGLSQQAQDGIVPLLGQSEAIRQYESDLQDAAGTSEEVANNQLQSLSAQWDLLKSQITDIGIGIGNHLLPPLTGLVSMLSDAVGVFVRVNDATDGWAATIGLVGTLVTGLAMAAGSASAVLGAGGFAMATTAAGGAIAGLKSAILLVLSPFTKLIGIVTGLPGLFARFATALNSVVFGAIRSVASILIGLPGTIARVATAFASTLVSGVVKAATALVRFPLAMGKAITAKIAGVFHAGVLSTAYSGLRTAALFAAGGIRTLGRALITSMLPLAALAVAAVALYAAWKTNFLGIRDITSGVVKGIKALISGDFSTVSDMIGGVAARAKKLWTTHIPPLLETARSIIGRIRSDVIAPFLAWFTPIWNKHLGIIAAEFKKTAQVWINTISGFVEWARPYVSAFLDAMTAWWGEHGDETMAIVRPLLSLLKRLFGDAFSIISDIVVTALRLMRGDFTGAKDSILSIVRTLTTGVVDLFRWLYNTLVGNSIIPEMASAIIQTFRSLKSDSIRIVRDMMNDVIQTIRNKVSDAKQAGKDLAKGFASGIKNAAGAPGRAAGKMAQGVRNKLTRSDAKEGPLSDLSKTGPALVKTFANGITSATRRAIRAIKKLVSAVRRYLPGSDAETGPLSDIASSGRALIETWAAAIESRTDLAKAAAGKVADAASSALVLAEDGSMVPSSFYDKPAKPSGGSMVRAEDGSMVPSSFYDKPAKPKKRKGMIQAEDGSWVPKSFYDKPAKAESSQSEHQLKLTEEAQQLLQIVDEDGNERDALMITSGNYGTM